MAEQNKGSTKEMPKKLGRRTVSYILAIMLWVFSSIIVSQYAIGYLMVWTLGVETFSKPVVTAIYSALSYVMAMLLVIIVPTKILEKKRDKKPRTKRSFKDLFDRKTLGLNGWPTWTDIGLAPVGFVAYLLLAAGLVALFTLFPWFDAGQAQEVGFSYYVSGIDRLVAFLTLVVIAPIAEEIIFRGWLYGQIREKLAGRYSNAASMVISIFLVSLLFGIVHMQWNVGVNVFALSIVLCGLREITGTIYSGILLHMLKNGVAFYLLYVIGIG